MEYKHKRGDLVIYNIVRHGWPQPAVFVGYTKTKQAIIRLATGQDRVVLLSSLTPIDAIDIAGDKV